MRKSLWIILSIYSGALLLGAIFLIVWKAILFYPNTITFDRSVYVLLSSKQYSLFFTVGMIWGFLLLFIMVMGLLIMYLVHKNYVKKLYSRILNNLITPETADKEIRPLIEYIDKLKNIVNSSDKKIKYLSTELEELKEMEDFKSQILANVSHELKSPLTTIKGYVEYILNGKMGDVTESQKKGLSVVNRSIKRLERQINMLISFAKEEKKVLNYQLFTMQKLTEELYLEYLLKTKEKNIEFSFDVPKDMHPVLADRDAIKEVFENLITNAIKFTPQGGKIKIEIEEITNDNENIWVRISIKDTGIGIPKNKQKMIFKRFYQIEQSDKRKYEGIGLGLPIVKEIVEAHGGRIDVESEEGKGTEFIIYIPMYQKGGSNE